MVTENKRLKSAYDTAANWTSGNPVLLPGEIGIEYDTKNVKVGDGSTSWTSLNYSSIGVTAYDSSLGRLAIGGIEIGDTGWRDISSGLLNGFAPNTGRKILLRRVGDTVFLVGRLVAPGSQTTFYTLPAGFTTGVGNAVVDGNTALAVNASTNSVLRVSHDGSNGILGIQPAPSASALIDLNISFSTVTAWPSSLPGTAA